MSKRWPQKQLVKNCFENLAHKLDNTFLQIKSLRLTTAIVPYALKVASPNYKTELAILSKTHIEYIITDQELTEKDFLFQFSFKTEHLGSLLISSIETHYEITQSVWYVNKRNSAIKFTQFLASQQWLTLYSSFLCCG